MYDTLIFQDEVDEITWQTYEGQLTEKQEKTRDKVIKRLEKVTFPVILDVHIFWTSWFDISLVLQCTELL